MDLSQPGREDRLLLSMSNDSTQEFFTDGFTEDLITELARFHSLSVLSQTSSFVFRNQSVSITEIGQRLAADFVLEGSVRKFGDHLRVSAQLNECETSRDKRTFQQQGEICSPAPHPDLFPAKRREGDLR